MADLNVPFANSQERMAEICSAIQFVNDLNPEFHAGLVELPEFPKKSSKRGLADEEKEVQDQLWSLRQACDARWIVPFDVHPSAEAQTSKRRHTCVVSLVEVKSKSFKVSCNFIHWVQ